jgi:hypothetical protein
MGYLLLIRLAALEMFLLEEVLYFRVDLLFDGVDEVVKIVEIVLSELALVEVDVVEELLSGLGED